jgi:hypothetical protein
LGSDPNPPLRGLTPKAGAVAAGDHAVFVEPAFEGAVEEHGLAGGGQADEAREVGIARKDEGGPAGEALLEGVAQLRIELGELLLLAESCSFSPRRTP